MCRFTSARRQSDMNFAWFSKIFHSDNGSRPVDESWLFSGSRPLDDPIFHVYRRWIGFTGVQCPQYDIKTRMQVYATATTLLKFMFLCLERQLRMQRHRYLLRTPAEHAWHKQQKADCASLPTPPFPSLLWRRSNGCGTTTSWHMQKTHLSTSSSTSEVLSKFPFDHLTVAYSRIPNLCNLFSVCKNHKHKRPPVHFSSIWPLSGPLIFSLNQMGPWTFERSEGLGVVW